MKLPKASFALTPKQRDAIAFGWTQGADAEKIAQVTGIDVTLVREELPRLDAEFEAWIETEIPQGE